MDDLISRKAAIDALKEHRALFCDNTPDTFSKLSYAEKSRVDELDMAIATLINLPSAQPEKRTDKCTETHSCDCISRQSAMEEISKQQTYKMFEGEDTLYLDANDVGSVIASLPSAQPEPCEDAVSREEAKWVVFCNRDHVEDQANAIDALPPVTLKAEQPDLSEYSDKLWKAAYERGKAEAQDEIVRCKECKHRDPEDHKCDCGHDIIWQLPRDDKWYCADAERRTDDTD